MRVRSCQIDCKLQGLPGGSWVNILFQHNCVCVQRCLMALTPALHMQQ